MSRIVDTIILAEETRVTRKVHTRLSPSKAHRWLVCPGSLHVVTEDPETEWAAEGTRKHAVLKLVLTGQDVLAGDIIKTEAGDYIIPLEVLEQCFEIKEFIDQFRNTHADWIVETETRVETGSYAWELDRDECAGTTDVAAYSWDELLVLDAKFGYVRVSATKNPQLMLYALGLLKEIPFPIKWVTLCIAQPDYDGQVVFREHRMPVQEIYDWAFDQRPIIEEIKSGSYRLQADEHACRYCPARTECPARLADLEKFRNEAWLQEANLEELLPLLPRIRQICNDLEQRAMTRINEGQPVRGWKLVQGKSIRKWPLNAAGETDEEAVRLLILEKVKTAKLPLDLYKKELKSPSEMQKDLRMAVNGGKGKGEMTIADAKAVIESIALKPPGGPRLVPESDPRPALEPNEWTLENLLQLSLEAHNDGE